jgi:hypothetical protein
MTGTGNWSYGPLNDAAGLLAVRIGVWNHFGYANPEPGQAGIPPLGQRGAESITAGHGAIDVIDQIISDLHRLRSQLADELLGDAEARAARVEGCICQAISGSHAPGCPWSVS